MIGFLSVTLSEALQNIFRNRLRSVLCIISILIGIGAIIVIVGIEDGARTIVRAQVMTMGDNVITILPGILQVGSVRARPGSMETLTMSDAMMFKREVPQVKEVCGIRQSPAQIVFGNKNWRTFVLGVNSGCIAVRGWGFLSGGMLSQLEWDGADSVVLLGKTSADALSPIVDEFIGATVLINGVPFRVIGILYPKGSDLDGDDQDNVAVIPFATAQKRLYKTRVSEAVDWIMVSAFAREHLPSIIENIRGLLRERHKLEEDALDTFSIETQAEVGEFQEELSWTLRQLFESLAFLALVVGGIGIMNVLLVSVAERTREIGVRMAVGAKRWHILMQFLIEAMTLGVIGGTLGVLCGIAGAWLITVIAGWPTIISGNTVVAALSFSLVIGLFSGLYPANRAARLNPVDALRYE